MAVGGQTTDASGGRRQEHAEKIRRQYLWNTPDGNLPDFSETYTHGEDILISWNALNNSMYDLWLTSWNYDPSAVTLCLARAVNLAHDGNLRLVTPDPPSAQFANRTRYVLRFKPPTEQGEFVASDPELSSPGFFIVQASADREATPTRIRAPPPTDVATPGSDSEDSAANMSTGASAALTIGLILAVALLVAIEVAYFTWRRRRRRDRDGAEGGLLDSARGKMSEADRGLFAPEVAERPGDSPWMSPELPGDSSWGQDRVHELQGGGRGDGSLPRRAATLNSSVVELEAGRER